MSSNDKRAKANGEHYVIVREILDNKGRFAAALARTSRTSEVFIYPAPVNHLIALCGGGSVLVAKVGKKDRVFHQWTGDRGLKQTASDVMTPELISAVDKYVASFREVEAENVAEPRP